MKIGIVVAIYLIANLIAYFYVYTQTKDVVAEQINWDGWFNKACNIFIVAWLAIPSLIYYGIRYKLESRNED